MTSQAAFGPPFFPAVLLALAQHDVAARWRRYEHLAQGDLAMPAPAATGD